MTTPLRIETRAGNDFYPLPADYAVLTEEGQRQARVNASRQWWAAPNDSLAAWASYVFFDKYYFQDPSFSDWYLEMNPLAYGSHQKDLIVSWHEVQSTLAIMPRDHAKTRICVGHGVVQRPLSRPRHTVAYIGPNNEKANEEITRAMIEFENNERMISDWAPEYGADKLSKNRGRTGDWSAHSRVFRLPNASRVKGGSIESGIRGMRAREVILDDVERDLKRSTDISAARQMLSKFLFHTLRPVAANIPGARFLWLGTILSPRHYIAMASSTDDDRDIRFDHWRKLVYQAGYPDIDNIERTLWPEKMSVEALVSERDHGMGREAVLAEYFNKPGHTGGGGFAITRALQEWVAYESDGVTPCDPLEFISRDLTAPRESNAVIKWVSPSEKVTKSATLSSLVESCPGVQSFDWAKSKRITADYSASPNGLFGSERELFVMDIAVGRWSPTERNTQIIRQAWRWRPRILGVEAFSVYQDVMEEIASLCEKLFAETGYRPRIKHIPIHGADKADKIMSLSWRFGTPEEPRGLIKLPFFLREHHPGLRMLIGQIEGANFEAVRLGLRNDDAIDAVRMMADIHSTSPKATFSIKEKGTSLKDKLLSGEKHDTMGLPLIERVGLHNLTAEEVDRIADREEEPNDGKWRWPEDNDRRGRRAVDRGFSQGGLFTL